jgi:hypothetical protein
MTCAWLCRAGHLHRLQMHLFIGETITARPSDLGTPTTLIIGQVCNAQIINNGGHLFGSDDLKAPRCGEMGQYPAHSCKCVRNASSFVDIQECNFSHCQIDVGCQGVICHLCTLTHHWPSPSSGSIRSICVDPSSSGPCISSSSQPTRYRLSSKHVSSR